MSDAYWTRRSFTGRGARTAHLIVGPGRKTACGTHLGYGNLAACSEGDTTGRCKRCAAKAPAPAPVRRATCCTCALQITYERARWMTFSGRTACDARPDFGAHSPAEGTVVEAAL